MPHRIRLRIASFTPLLAAALLAGCTVVGPKHTPPALTQITVKAPAWNAPLPHAGDAQSLKNWWASWNDPALSALIEATQTNSPTLAQAAARIAQARASERIAGSANEPEASGSSSLSRGAQGGPTATNWSTSAQALWELDLFGGKIRSRQAATARLEARSIEWHDARVSLAAEVATIYASLRVNEALAVGFAQDRVSRAETARLTELKANAGFEAPANAALANAAVADAHARILSQQAEIDLNVKALVALTELAEREVRALLTPGHATLPKIAGLSVANVPAQALAQRPDLAAIERDLAALTADIGVAEADRYPRISLSGSIGYSISRALGNTSDGALWGFGPSISVPLFDAGRRLATVDVAKARHDELSATYRATATRAVRETEEALTRLNVAQLRAPDLRKSLEGYEAFTRAANARLKAGVGTVLELEDARRAVLGAQVAILNTERDRLLAWVALYRAVGGGWSTTDSVKG
jgi:outer membrane protein, multidrug efflux system